MHKKISLLSAYSEEVDRKGDLCTMITPHGYVNAFTALSREPSLIGFVPDRA